MGFRTIFIESSCRLSYSSGYMVVRTDEGTNKIHLSEVSIVILQTTQAYISAYLLSELAKSKISLVVPDEKRNPVGEYLPLYGAHNVSKRVLSQMNWTEPSKKRVWQHVVRDKIFHQAELLRQRGFIEEASVLITMCSEVRSGDTTNREAAAARMYFSVLFGCDFSRDMDCVINAALNYGYGVLLSMVNREIVSRGYLTQCGICHRSEYNQFNFACDLMEPFRPVVDRIVFDFIQDDFGRDERRLLADLANKQVSFNGGVYKLGSVTSLYIQDCLNALNKKITPEDIRGYEFV